MGSNDKVASPTFTISREYNAGNLTLYHFDFYRLAEPGIMADELAEIIEDSKAVIAIEWAAIVEAVLPDNRLTIGIKALGEFKREFTFKYPQKLAYLIEKET